MTPKTQHQRTDESTPDQAFRAPQNIPERGDFGLDFHGQPSVNREAMSTISPPQPATPGLAPGSPLVLPKAVIYLRVSTRDQATRGGREEGFSIPAQRDATKRKAAELGAFVAKEFVEGGVSGTTMNRPALKKMLAYIEERSDIQYVIVHKLDRLARNRHDDAIIFERLQSSGVKLISTTEVIDQGPIGGLVHGIIASVNQFYSENLRTEVLKGMNEKAASGGTVSRAPLGYLNKRGVAANGAETRYVEPDPERADLIRKAFELYATGEWTTDSLAEHLAARGLTTRPTPKRPAKPVTAKIIGATLTNPYYRGIVTWKGAEHPGNHEPLVDDSTWFKVQSVMASRRHGEYNRVHNHFLKSTVVCGRCGSRLIVQMTTSRSGDLYPYFVCVGRRSKRTDCDLKAVLIHEVEKQVEHLYQNIRLSHDERVQLEQYLREEIALASTEQRQRVTQLKATADDLKNQQRKLLQLHYQDAISADLLKEEQDRLGAELARIKRELERATADHDSVLTNLSDALTLAEDCDQLYKSAPEHIKRQLNQVFYDVVRINPDVHGQLHAQGELAEPFNQILNPALRLHAAHAASQHTIPTNAKRPAPKGEPLAHEPENREQTLTGIFHASGFTPGSMVDLRGLEPLTPCMPCRCATSCATDPKVRPRRRRQLT